MDSMFNRRSDTTTHREKGPSLARGPAWIVGSLLAAFGLAMFFNVGGTPLPTTGFPDGEVQGQSFLGFEGNAWTAWLTTAAGVLVLIGVVQHAFTKTMALLVGLALGAMSVIALFDGEDVLGLAAANGFTKLGWGIAAAFLIITALLPRVQRRVKDQDTHSTGHTGTGSHKLGHKRDHDRDDDGRDDRLERDHGRTSSDHDRDNDGRDDRLERDHGTHSDTDRHAVPTAAAAIGGPEVSRPREGVDHEGNDQRTRVEHSRVVSRDGQTEPEIATDDQRTRGRDGWPTHADELAGRQQDAGIADPANPNGTPRTTSNRTF